MEQTETVFVQNRTARMLGPSYLDGEKPAVLRLLPGTNKVLRSLWAKVENNSLVVEHVAAELLVVLDGKPDLQKMPLTRACEAVLGTYDEALLRAWRADETRRPVRETIDRQLERIDESNPDRERQPMFAPANPIPHLDGTETPRPRPRFRR